MWCSYTTRAVVHSARRVHTHHDGRYEPLHIAHTALSGNRRHGWHRTVAWQPCGRPRQRAGRDSCNGMVWAGEAHSTSLCCDLLLANIRSTHTRANSYIAYIHTSTHARARTRPPAFQYTVLHMSLYTHASVSEAESCSGLLIAVYTPLVSIGMIRSSWNHFGGNVNEKVLMDAADMFVAQGLAAAGYQYINLGACMFVVWSAYVKMFFVVCVPVLVCIRTTICCMHFMRQIQV